jgi:hypothetical protein
MTSTPDFLGATGALATTGLGGGHGQLIELDQLAIGVGEVGRRIALAGPVTGQAFLIRTANGQAQHPGLGGEEQATQQWRGNGEQYGTGAGALLFLLELSSLL